MKTLEFCAREASQIFGGSSIVKEGKGKIIERIYRVVRSSAIPGSILNFRRLRGNSVRFYNQKC
jgi:hypothetical protein